MPTKACVTAILLGRCGWCAKSFLVREDVDRVGWARHERVTKLRAERGMRLTHGPRQGAHGHGAAERACRLRKRSRNAAFGGALEWQHIIADSY